MIAMDKWERTYTNVSWLPETIEGDSDEAERVIETLALKKAKRQHLADSMTDQINVYRLELSGRSRLVAVYMAM